MGIKRVLVTGASGFLGSHICEAAHEAGYEVHALIRERSSRRWLNHDWLRIHVADASDRQVLAAVLKGVDCVIDCIRIRGSNPMALCRQNLKLIGILIEESLAAGVKRIVYSSSLIAGGPGRTARERDENDSHNPITFYGKRKKAAEEMLRAAGEKIHVVCLRYAFIYGPRDPRTFTMFKTIQKTIVPVIGLKPSFGSMVHVHDAAQAAVLAISADVPSGSIYQVTDGDCFSYEELYDYLEEAVDKDKVGRRIRIPFWLAMLASWFLHHVFRNPEIYPDRVRQFKASYWCASCKKARKELGFEPRVKLRQGLVETAKWFQSQVWPG